MTVGEHYLANFPFGRSSGMKLRPVLLLSGPMGNVPEVIVAYVSSVIPATLLASDLLLDPQKPEHASTHLKTVSLLRLHKLATLHGRSLVRFLGHVSPATLLTVAVKLRAVLSL